MFFARRLIAAVTAVALVGAIACNGDGDDGGGGSPAPEATSSGPVGQYFDEWSRLLCDVGASQRDFRTARAGDQSFEAIAEYNQLFVDYLAELEALTPPDEVASVHARYLTAAKELSALVTLGVEGVRTIEAGGEATPVPDYVARRDAASEESGAAIEAVRARARELGIDKALGCPDDF